MPDSVIYAQPVGPGPATPAPLYINAGLSFPQFLGVQHLSYKQNQDSITFTPSQFDGQGQLVVLPITDVNIFYADGVSLTPAVLGPRNITVTGKTVKVDLYSTNYRDRDSSSDYALYKIWPRGNQSYGITFSNSANFFSISDSGVVGQCIHAFKGKVAGHYQIPNVAGFDMSRAQVFAGWNQSGVTVDYDRASKQVRVWNNVGAEKNGSGTINEMRIAVFCNGASIPEHNGGLNIYDPTGKKCVFSTYRTPFAIKGFYNTSGANLASSVVGTPMILLCKPGLADFNSGGNHGWISIHSRGHTMVNKVVGTGFGETKSTFTNEYGDIGTNDVMHMTLPYLDSNDIIR